MCVCLDAYIFLNWQFRDISGSLIFKSYDFQSMNLRMVLGTSEALEFLLFIFPVKF